MLLGDVVRHGIGPYGVGVLVLVAAVVVLRAKDVPLFIEQLAVPALLVGGGTLAMGVYRDFHNANGHAIMLIVVLALALVISKSWLRVLAGAMASALLALALLPSWGWMRQQGSMLLVLHGLLALWLLATANWALWRRLPHLEGYDGSLAALVLRLLPLGLGGLLLLLSLTAWPRGMKPLWIALPWIAGAAQYFMTAYGTVMDGGMINNILQTDLRESSDLFNPQLLLQLLLVAGLPTAWLLRLRVIRPRRGMQTVLRTLALLAAYEASRLPATSQVVLTNRSTPPDFIIMKADELSGGQPFGHIDELISQDELRAIARHYEQVAGFANPQSQG